MTCATMFLVCVVGGLYPWLTFATTLGVDLLLLLQLWLDGPIALLVALTVGVPCVCPCELGMYYKLIFVLF